MPSRIARERAARVDGLKPLAEKARRNLDAGGNLETVMGTISPPTSFSWKDAEAALLAAKNFGDEADPHASFAWATLALAILGLIERDAHGIVGRFQRRLLQGSRHGKRLEGYAYVVRGASAVELGRLDEAQEDLEAAHTAYSAARVGEREALQVNLRLVNLQLVRQDWQQAEWLAETTLHRLSRVGTSADRAECSLLLAHAQFGMGQLEATLDSIREALRNADSRESFIRARAYLLKARVELENNLPRDATDDLNAARALFLRIGNQRGLHDCETVRDRIEQA